MKTLVIDLATHLGYAIIENNKIIESGNLDLSKEKTIESYVSTQCRKTPPKGVILLKGSEYHLCENLKQWENNVNGWCLVKEKKVVKKLSISKQLSKLEDFLLRKNFDKIVIEAPAIPFGTININAIRKQFALYGIVDLVFDSYEEITPNEWFNWIREEYRPFNAFKETKSGERRIDRKATSMIVANQLVEKEILDDNEADAICLAHYIINKESDSNE